VFAFVVEPVVELVARRGARPAELDLDDPFATSASWIVCTSPPTSTSTVCSAAAVTRPVTLPPSRRRTSTRRPTLRRQCRGSVSGRSTPGEVTSRT
jgi:hypothetical protein